VLASLALLGARLPGAAQDNKPADDQKAQEGGPRGSLIVAGYTRPGNPPDREKGGKIVPGGYLAGNPDFKGIGGTIFFAVYRLTNEEGDVWGTGVKDFDTAFVPGVDYNSADSPGLDTRAKYLYLYQVVNSRGLDPISPIVFAANQEKGTDPIATAAVRLRVDPRYITSWGYFKASSFNLGVVPEDLDGNNVPVRAAAGEKGKAGAVKGAAGEKKAEPVAPAFEEDRDGLIRMAVSVNPSILGSLSTNAYLKLAPSHVVRRMRVGDATLNLTDSPAVTQLRKRVENLKKNNERPAAWADEMLKSAIAATQPMHVRLVLSEPDARLFLKADWFDQRDAGLLNLADHSTVFGFTTDLPPGPEPAGIASTRDRDKLLALLG
jgi:hypothetical protein